MKLKIRFPGKLLPSRKPSTISNLPPEIPKEKSQTPFIVGLLILWLVIFIISLSKCKAQDMQGLKIGDRVPDATMSPILNYSNSSAKISDFKGKLLILDFWATWCSSCINSFPKSYAVQQQVPNMLQVLLVDCRSTHDDKNKILSFFEKRKSYYNFPCVVLDTTLGKMFPHSSIPHYVWIKDNVVIAITDESQLNLANVRKLSAYPASRLDEKTFIRFDPGKPLFSEGNGGKAPGYQFTSFLARYKSGLQNFSGFVSDTNGMFVRIDVLNFSRMGLLRFAFPQLTGMNSDRVILRVNSPDSFSLVNPSNSWKADNVFSYEASFPPCSRAVALSYMQADLSKFFQVRIDAMDKKVSCFILKVSDSTKINKASALVTPESNINEGTGAPVYFSDYSLDEILQRFETINKIPFINESNYIGRINLTLPADLTNITALQKSLIKQGFKLENAESEIKFIIISDQATGIQP